MTSVFTASGSEDVGDALYLAFDYGLRRIGVAVGHAATRHTRALPTLTHRGVPDWAALRKLVADWAPAGCVVGLPFDLDGGEQEMTDKARTFARELERHCGVRVHLCDERFSSRAADAQLRQARATGQMRRRVRKGDRDATAARLILEQFFAGQGKPQ